MLRHLTPPPQGLRDTDRALEEFLSKFELEPKPDLKRLRLDLLHGRKPGRFQVVFKRRFR